MDFSRHSTNVPFARAKAKATMYNVVKDELSPVESPAVVVMDIALRDRDFARLQAAQEGLETLRSMAFKDLLRIFLASFR